jgi:hypothetical protein
MRIIQSLLVMVFGTMLPMKLVHAETPASQFLSQCKAGIRAIDGDRLTVEQHTKAIECLSYLHGFIDAILLTPLQANGKPIVCLPDAGVSVYQVARIAIKWAEDNPSRLHEDRQVMVVSSLVGAFPCGKK